MSLATYSHFGFDLKLDHLFNPSSSGNAVVTYPTVQKIKIIFDIYMLYLFHNELPKGVRRICTKGEYFTLEEFKELKEKYLSNSSHESTWIIRNFFILIFEYNIIYTFENLMFWDYFLYSLLHVIFV